MTPEEMSAEEALAVRAAERIRRIHGYRGATPTLTVEQATARGPQIADLARLVVDRWRETKGDMPQPLSMAVMELRQALITASTAGGGHG
jgi:hypothetical protein